MSSIGALTFLRIEGKQLPPLATEIKPFERQGIDGSTFIENARKSEEIYWETVEGVGALATANMAANDYADMKGTIVTVVEDLGRTVNNVLVLDVRVMGVKQVFASSIEGVNYLIKANWILKFLG